jgi:hypothetical protein
MPRFLQFRLRTVLIGTAIVGAALAIVCHWLRTLERQIQLANGLGLHQLASALPPRLDVFGSRSPKKVVGLIVNYPTGEKLQAVSEIKSLKSLVLGDSADEGLFVSFCETHDRSLSWKGRPGSFWVDLTPCEPVSLNAGLDDVFVDINAELRHLKALTDLQVLQLDYLQIDDRCIAHLAAMKHLERLYVRHTRLSPHGLARLRAELPNTTIVAEHQSWEPAHMPTSIASPTGTKPMPF